MPSVLLATLGAEPQIIPLATSLLLAREPLAAVIVLHTAADLPPVATALPMLQAAFAGQAGWPPLRLDPLPLDDVLAPAELDLFAERLYTQLRGWAQQGARLHLLLAGGRKSMAMVGMSVAQLVLGPDDHVWYLHSSEDLRRSGRTAPADGDAVTLVPIPLPRLAVAPPAFLAALQSPTRAGALAALDARHGERLRHFLAHDLTAAERDVALLMARELLTVEQAAQQLNKSAKTVTNQLNSIYSKLESAFGLSPDVGLKREFLRRELGGNGEKDGSWLP
jgi:DNA-binding CsgD family transcriptional regulator